MRFYGSEYGNLLYNFGPTSDGGYYFGGTTNTSNSNAGQGFIQKTDKNGTILWYKEYGGPLQDLFDNLHPTSDGGFIAVGATSSFGNGAMRKDYYWDAYLVKTDADGNLVWQKTFGNIYNDQFFDVTETPDNGFVAVGNTYDPIYGGTCTYIVKTDRNGNKLWSKELNPSLFYSDGYSVTIGPNNDIAIAGYMVKSNYAIDQRFDYPSFILLSANGLLLDYNSSTMSFPEYETWGGLVFDYDGSSVRAEKIISLADGYLFATNLNPTQGVPPYLFNLFKVDLKGNVLWNHEYSGLGSAAFNDIKVNANGGFLISGFTIDALGNHDCWILSTDANGSKTWEADIPVSGYTAFAAGIAPSGKNYAIGTNLISPLVKHANYFGFMIVDQNGKIVENGK